MDTPEPIPHALEPDGDGLLLRPWRTEDAPALLAAVQESLATVGRWLPWCHAGYDLAAAHDWVAFCRRGWTAGEHYAFAVLEQASGTLLGGAGINQRNRPHRSGNLGYWVRQSRQGEGIAARAAAQVARFGFARLDLIRIEVVVLPDNRASLRTAEKLGARFEAVARQRIWAWQRPMDAAVYGLIPSDLAQPAAQSRSMSS
ncbi:ribosomal-protein-serine acetyltransferase [Frateuria sp. Soil773]|uniref:GNAT family N-acetyltransferase n=1 Tax=Frateuria sp. Soil773 TaxID=1736407 RepID=UPI0006FC44DA|nr:GNAT family protein [Frateuria sp. Soil773]KRE89093.1 ribosomal-protein-serine acetyltransferase [Frateuria sp. Soil773]